MFARRVGRFSPLFPRLSLRDVEKARESRRRLQTELEKSLDRWKDEPNPADPLQNEAYAVALYSLWAAFSESLHGSGSGWESGVDLYAFDEATKYERAVHDRFRF